MRQIQGINSALICPWERPHHLKSGTLLVWNRRCLLTLIGRSITISTTP